MQDFATLYFQRLDHAHFLLGINMPLNGSTLKKNNCSIITTQDGDYTTTRPGFPVTPMHPHPLCK